MDKCLSRSNPAYITLACGVATLARVVILA
jgi:hypothetical protein